ncbi:MAG: 7TM diverse intracellular signaling domain-containing protein [Desulfobacteraceae bacterium]|jgi:PAS domain S-box-containing protein
MNIYNPMPSMQRRIISHDYCIVALALLICSLLILSACRNESTRRIAPEAVKGVLDLTEWDLEKNGLVKLKGEWEFYWQQHLSPDELSKPTTSQRAEFMQIPEYWNNYEIDGVELPGEGYATYRLVVRLGQKTQPLALRVMEISTASTLFVNGKHLISAGVTGTDRNTTTPKWCRQVVDFEPYTDDLEIVLHVSNFHHRRGGMWEVIELGTEKGIRQSQEKRLGFDLFLFGSIFMVGLYHLGLFIVRRKDRSPLYFSIICFLIALRLFTTSERFLIRLLPDLGWEILIKLEYLSFYLAVPAFCLFMQSLFPKYSKRILYTICLLGVGFSLIVLITQARFFSQFIDLYEIITFLTLVYGLYVILVSLNEKRMEALVFLLGFMMLALMTINDILYVQGIIETGYLAPFGLFAFIFSQAFLLSFRFSTALATVESQDRDLRTTLESYKTEIINRTQAEEAMRQSEEKYRTILHSIEEGYYEVDLDGNLTFFNDSVCKILGYPKEELIGMNYRQFMGEKTAEQVYETFRNVSRSGKATKAFDWESISKDGKKKYIETSVSSMLDSEGQSIGLRGVARDVTERKKAEEQAKVHQQQLMHADKMVALGTLVSGMAHEINNPNNFIMLNSPILKDAWENAMPIIEKYYEENGDFVIGGMNYSEIRENIPTLFSGISEGAERIKKIVDDLKNYVRDDTADLAQAVDINAVFMSAVSLVSNMIKKSTNHFDIDYGKDLPLIKGNFQRLEQVAINLIQNACQALTATDKGIFISTSIDKETSNIIIRVKDGGTGIAPEMLSQITDPFFTTRQKSGGVGLGLSISSRIIEEHGGSLQFASQPGVGTTAEVILVVDQ